MLIVVDFHGLPVDAQVDQARPNSHRKEDEGEEDGKHTNDGQGVLCVGSIAVAREGQ